jgi:hypothetical protein
MRDVILFDGSSASGESPLFYVTSGWFGVLTGFGFEPAPVAVASDLPKTMQRACVKLVHLDFEIGRDFAPCGTLPDVPKALLAGLLEAPAVSRGRAWQLSACDTIALIDVPGIYRLALNDQAAVGAVTVHLKAMTADAMRRPSGLYFGE